MVEILNIRKYNELEDQRKKSEKECLTNIKNMALDLLEERGFERTNNGTEYLSEIITMLYHERKVFKSKSAYNDFDDHENLHYPFIADGHDGVDRLDIYIGIYNSIKNSYLLGDSRNDVIYEVTNDIISQVDRTDKKLIYVSKLSK